MSCGVDRFTITRGIDNVFTFTIKANGSTLPLQIEPTDTFSYKLNKLKDNTTDAAGNLVVEDAANGKINLTLSVEATNTLMFEKGEKADRYYIKPIYQLLIICNTVNNGSFIAKVSEVYVD